MDDAEACGGRTNNFLLRDEKRQLVSSGVGKLAQLDPLDLGADVRRDPRHLRIFQEIRKGRISVLAMLRVRKRLQGRISVSTSATTSMNRPPAT
jgi:hypothetical protein